jgi:hypothetical protein
MTLVLIVPSCAGHISPQSAATPTASEPCGRGAEAPGNCLLSLSFIDDNDGFGLYGPQTGNGNLPLQLVATRDAGHMWRAVGPSPVTGINPTSFTRKLVFVDLENGFLLGTNGFFATRNGGHSWSETRLPGEVIDLARFGQSIWAATTTCPLFGPASAPCTVGIEASGDAGKNWQAVPVPQAPYHDAQVAFGTAGTAFVAVWSAAVGNGPGEILVGSVDGTNWRTHPLPCPVGYRLDGRFSVAGASDTLWMICDGQGTSGIEGVITYRSTDGGTHWSRESNYSIGRFTGASGEAPARELEHLVALSATKALLLDSVDGLVQTTDGGVTWRQAGPLAMQHGLYGGEGSVEAVDPTHVWVGAWSPQPGFPRLWRTTDGARSWQPT